MDRGLTAYAQALDALFARTGSTSKFGLERTFAFLEALGNPHRQLTCLHVAGTNGKGSVVAILYDLLRAKGLSVGRYTSPHLIDFRERIVVDDEQVNADYVVDFLARWEKESGSIGATFFEITTAMAFRYLADKEVDVAVIETGLGGRLDATNVIEPRVSGITSISIDHVEYLGGTESEIAREKAGIIKRGVPAVIGPMSTDARRAILKAAADSGASSVIAAADVFSPSDVRVSGDATRFTISHAGESAELRMGLIGEAQAGNASVALTMLHAAGGQLAVDLDDARRVLPSVRLPGRFQRSGNCIFDVAHNSGGFALLADTLDKVSPPRPITAIVGILKDKNWREMIETLASHVDSFVLVAPPGAPAERAWNPEEALSFALARGIEARISDFGDAVRSIRSQPGTVLVTGSFHTVGDAQGLLGAR